MRSPSATCSQHSLREAVGICVRCREPMCSECVTKIDGINHCRSCLEALVAARKEVASVRPRARLPGWFVLTTGFGLLSCLCWLTIEVLMPGQGP